MNPWTLIQIAISGIGVLFVIIGNMSSASILSYAGVVLLGVTAIIMGLEAVIKRQMILGSRYLSDGIEIYHIAAAVAQGILFMLLGAFLIGISFIAHFDTGRSVVHYFVRHPGPILIAFGVYCFATAVVAIVGSVEQERGSHWTILVGLLSSSLLPALILVLIGLAATSLGLLEVATPQVFDQLGGGYLEILFGAQ